MSKTRRQLEALVEALDDVPIDDADVKAEVERLGVDVPALEARVLSMLDAADERDRDERIEKARASYAAELEVLTRKRIEEKEKKETETPNREALLATVRTLLTKAPREVAMHFHKYESTTDEDLVDLIRRLRHLLGKEGEGEGE